MRAPQPDVESNDGHFVVHAKRERRRIHYLQPFWQHVEMGDFCNRHAFAQSDQRKPGGQSRRLLLALTTRLLNLDLGFRFPEVRHRLRDPRDVREIEILRDDRSPAVRSKFDGCHPRSLAKE